MDAQLQQLMQLMQEIKTELKNELTATKEEVKTGQGETKTKTEIIAAVQEQLKAEIDGIGYIEGKVDHVEERVGEVGGIVDRVDKGLENMKIHWLTFSPGTGSSKLEPPPYDGQMSFETYKIQLF